MSAFSSALLQGSLAFVISGAFFALAEESVDSIHLGDAVQGSSTQPAPSDVASVDAGGESLFICWKAAEESPAGEVR